MLRRSISLRDSLVRAASTVRTTTDWPVSRVAPSGRGHRVQPSAESFPGASQVPGARSPKLARVEAVLFAAGEPLSTRRIADAANLADGAEARVLVQELKNLYDADGSAFTVQSIAGGWHLCTKSEYVATLEKMHPNRHPSRLSQPAVETLAVVAYRQPILRADVESIRGVACGEMLRQLIERGLVRIVGHHDSLGRPLLYGTTRKFLEVFGLADLADLPIAEQLRRPAHTRVERAPSPSEPPEPGEPAEHLAPSGTEADQ
jgi:segregation and condensation protein B